MADPSSVSDPNFESFLHRTNTDTDLLIGRVLDERYRLISLIAEGGMGRVYRAEQVNLGKILAVKVLTPQAVLKQHDPHFRERFAREAATASRLSNPHTVAVFDYGKTPDGIYYIAMEFVDGCTLSQLIRNEGRLHPSRAAAITRQVCVSLREAHQLHIVHRDIKPANVLILNQGYEFVKVVDFGIAKMIQPDCDGEHEEPRSELTQVGTYVGTPEYMPPEAFTARVDPRSDLYSVGVLLYLMLAGRLPFKGTVAADTIMQVLHEPPPPLGHISGVTPALEAVVKKCLEKRPDLRYQSMDELLLALSEALQVSGYDPLTTTQVNPVPELEADLLSPLTTAGQLTLAEKGLPSWLASRKQQVAFLGSMLLVLLTGLGVSLLLRPKLEVVAPPLPGATTGQESAASEPVQAGVVPAPGPAPPAAQTGPAPGGSSPAPAEGQPPAAVPPPGAFPAGPVSPPGPGEATASTGTADGQTPSAAPSVGSPSSSRTGAPTSRRSTESARTRSSKTSVEREVPAESPDRSDSGSPRPSRLEGYKDSPY